MTLLLSSALAASACLSTSPLAVTAASRDTTAAAASTVAQAGDAAPATYAYKICYYEIETELDALIDDAIAQIVEGDVIEDEILGHYVMIASLVRAISFREGKLLEQAVERVSKIHPDLVVLTKSIRLPLVKAATEAVVNNNWARLDRLMLDCEAPAKGTYTPDLIIVNTRRHMAFILDLKRSLASYGDTSRLEELKLKMMASALILPDWLYKNHKRLMVDTVGVAIVDGASRPSDHEHGVWALDELDDILGISGAAKTLGELRRRFGARVQAVLEQATRKALSQTTMQPTSAASVDFPAHAGAAAVVNEAEEADDAAGADAGDDVTPDEEPELVHPVRLKIGFARRLLPH